MAMERRYFPGLNSLRFLAALFVVLSHIHSVQVKNALPSLSNFGCLNRGHDAVVFFFTLSGFLITYLLLEEQNQTQEIHLKNFYIRRILRIWPLYFLVVAVGFLLYWGILPVVGIQYPSDYNLWTGLLLYVLFLSNVMSALFQVGGILNVTWSIGVEEQFYLFWPPLLKCFKNSLFLFLVAFTILMLLLAVINQANIFQFSAPIRDILKTLQFHNMAIGALAAYGVFYHEEQLLRLPVFSNQLIQLLMIGLLIGYYFYDLGTLGFYAEFFLPFVYAWLILNVSVNHNSVIHLDNKMLNWLGTRSYGIYMYHMMVIYLLLFLAKKIGFTAGHSLSQSIIFYILGLLCTILLAHVSYIGVEKRFLSLKDSLRAAP
jgi:peptidoglycan/LPS O-acetylase OafA/YrhL